MKNFKLGLTLLGAKTVYRLIRLTNAGEGTSFIGSLVLKLDPSFIKKASDLILGAKIAVTGTNGKTTTSGIIFHILENNGRNVIANSKGANMLTGVANAFALSLNLSKKYENCVIESDEAYLAKIQKSLNTQYLLVTNLFRDQLDRYGELEFTKQKIQEGIDVNSDVQLVLNADDPLVSSLKSSKSTIYYGVNSVVDNTGAPSTSSPDEIFNCPCGNRLNYAKKFYAQQGHYSCSCGYSRPRPQFEADIVLEKDFSVIKLGEEEFRVPLVGLFNAYNALGAIALLKTIGVEKINEGLSTFKTAFGRSETREVRGHRTIIQLIKNPAGASQVLRSVDLESNVVIMINDNYADGRDVSWLWDTDFERLAPVKNKIIVSGIRANDMATRLKYAGVPVDKIEVVSGVEDAIDYVTTIAENNITILPSYTALLELNKLWKKF